MAKQHVLAETFSNLDGTLDPKKFLRTAWNGKAIQEAVRELMRR
jgi:hypothetical protein